MESNTYTKREGTGELPHDETVVPYLTTCPRCYDLLFPYSYKATFSQRTISSSFSQKDIISDPWTEFRTKKAQRRSLMTLEVYLIFLFTAIQMTFFSFVWAKAKSHYNWMNQRNRRLIFHQLSSGNCFIYCYTEDTGYNLAENWVRNFKNRNKQMQAYYLHRKLL